MREDMNTYRGYWSERQKEKRPLGRPRDKWVDNIKIDLGGELRWDGMDWIDLWLRIGSSKRLL
jgi:hypothetical protein